MDTFDKEVKIEEDMDEGSTQYSEEKLGDSLDDRSHVSSESNKMSDNSYKCTICGERFGTDKTLYYKHIIQCVRCQNDKSYSCNTCSKECGTDKPAYHEHRIRHCFLLFLRI